LKFLGQSQGQAVLGAQALQQPKTSVDGKLEALAAASLLKGSQKLVRHPEPVTAKELAKDKVLNHLAAEFTQDGIHDSLTLQELAISGLLKGEKPLLPVNFVTVFSGCSLERRKS
jgi:hypothetical protein